MLTEPLGFGIDIAIFISDRYEKMKILERKVKTFCAFVKIDVKINKIKMCKANKKELEYNLNLRRVIW